MATEEAESDTEQVNFPKGDDESMKKVMCEACDVRDDPGNPMLLACFPDNTCEFICKKCCSRKKNAERFKKDGTLIYKVLPL